MDDGWVRLLCEGAGVTIVLTQSSLFKRFREAGPKLWRDFSKCPLCIGVWVGMLIRWRELHEALGPAGALTLYDWLLALVGFGAATGTLALLVKRLYDYLESSAVRDDLDAEQISNSPDALAQMSKAFEDMNNLMRESEARRVQEAADYAAREAASRQKHEQLMNELRASVIRPPRGQS